MKQKAQKKNKYEKEIEKMRRKLKTNFNSGYVETIPNETPTKIPDFPHEPDKPTPYGWYMKQF